MMNASEAGRLRLCSPLPKQERMVRTRMTGTKMVSLCTGNAAIQITCKPLCFRYDKCKHENGCNQIAQVQQGPVCVPFRASGHEYRNGYAKEYQWPGISKPRTLRAVSFQSIRLYCNKPTLLCAQAASMEPDASSMAACPEI